MVRSFFNLFFFNFGLTLSFRLKPAISLVLADTARVGPILATSTRVRKSTWQDVARRAVSGVPPASDAGVMALEPHPCILVHKHNTT